MKTTTTTMRAAAFTIAAVMGLVAGCGESEPDPIQQAAAARASGGYDVESGLSSGQDTQPTSTPSFPSSTSLLARSTSRAPTSASLPALANPTATPKPSPRSTPTPSSTTGTAAPAVPPPAAAAPATAPPTTRPPATAPPTTAAPAPATARPAPAVATAAPAGVVEFRIPAGTGNGPWNTFGNRVQVTVGQTLRIYNDDSIAHTAHSTGVPFGHGRSIQPGQSLDHLIVAPLTPDGGRPVNYDHNAGAGAAFWVEAFPQAQGQGETGPAGPADVTTAEAESLRLLNGLRANLGVQLVTPSDREMQRFARGWALEMRNTGFRHSSPPVWFENIVWWSDETMTPAEAAAKFHQMWVDSPGHYQNMTNPDWSIVGIGMYHDETGWWGVHVFR